MITHYWVHRKCFVNKRNAVVIIVHPCKTVLSFLLGDLAGCRVEDFLRNVLNLMVKVVLHLAHNYLDDLLFVFLWIVLVRDQDLKGRISLRLAFQLVLVESEEWELSFHFFFDSLWVIDDQCNDIDELSVFLAELFHKCEVRSLFSLGGVHQSRKWVIHDEVFHLIDRLDDTQAF